MLSDQEILERLKAILDEFQAMDGATLNGQRELNVVRNVLTFSIVKLAKRTHDRTVNDNRPSVADGSGRRL